MKILRADKKITIPLEYEHLYLQAFLTFKFQRVWCPIEQKLVHTELPEESLYGAELGQMQSLDFLGAYLDHKVAMGIANGDLDPINLTDFATSEIDLRVIEKICGKRKAIKVNKASNNKKK